MSKLIKAGWIISLILGGLMTGNFFKSLQATAETIEAIHEVPSGGEIKLLDLEDHNENKFMSLSFQYTILDQVEFVFKSNEARLVLSSIDYNKKSVSVHFELLSAHVKVELGVKNQSISLLRQIYFEMARDYSYAISAVSQDQAQIRLLDYEYNLNLISEEEKNSLAKTILNQSVQETITQTSTNNSSVKFNGYFTWTDDYGSIHLMRGTKVEIIKKTYLASGTLLSESVIFSDEIHSQLGEISMNDTLSLSGGSTATYLVKTYAGGMNTKVVDGDLKEFVHESQPITLQAGAIINLTQNFSMATDLGRAMQIGQAVTFYDRETHHIDYKPMASCTVVYSDARTAYSRGMIYLQAVRNPIVSDLPNSYANWDVIGHEYAHHVQVSLGFANSFGGSHMANVNMADYYLSLGYGEFEAKYLGSRLAWSEGWATYFAVSMQRLDFDDFAIEYFGDDIYTSYNGVVKDLNDRSDLKGETCEDTISTFLYRIMQQYGLMDSWSGDWDWPMEDLWNLVTRNKIGSLSEMFNVYYQDELENQDMAPILEEFGFIALNLQLRSGNTLNVAPTFSWSKPASSSAFSMDDFELVFLNSNMEKEFAIPTRGNMSHTLTTSQWKIVKDMPGIYYYVYVASRSVKGYETGAYNTAFLKLDKPLELISQATIRPADYGFAQQYFNDVQPPVTHTLGEVSFVTTRLRTGYIEKEYIVMSPKKTGAGLAYIKYDFAKPVYKMSVDMALWSDKEFTETDYCRIDILFLNQYGEDEYLEVFWKNDLPKDRKTPETFIFHFPEGASHFEFRVTSPATGSDNKGRVCIGNMQVSQQRFL